MVQTIAAAPLQAQTAPAQPGAPAPAPGGGLHQLQEPDDKGAKTRREKAVKEAEGILAEAPQRLQGAAQRQAQGDPNAIANEVIDIKNLLRRGRDGNGLRFKGREDDEKWLDDQVPGLTQYAQQLAASQGGAPANPAGGAQGYATAGYGAPIYGPQQAQGGGYIA